MKVFVSGSFDLLHSGHVAFLEEASQYGDLYVGIGSDESIKYLKDRLTVCFQDERLFMVKAIKYVKDANINSGMGLEDFKYNPFFMFCDILIVNEDQDSEEKRLWCNECGKQYIVLKRTPHEGLPKRSSTEMRNYERDDIEIIRRNIYNKDLHPISVVDIGKDNKRMVMTTKEEIIKGFKITNPYSETAFPTVEHGKLQDIVKLLENNGYSFDNLYGNIGRAVWNNCIMQVVELMDNHIEKDFLVWLSHRPAVYENDELLLLAEEEMYFKMDKIYEFWLINIKK